MPKDEKSKKEKSKSWNPMSLLRKKEDKVRPQSAPPSQAIGSSMADNYFSEKYILNVLKDELDSLRKGKNVSEGVYNAFVKQVRSCSSKEDVQKYIAQLRRPNAAQAVTLFLDKDNENKKETYESVSNVLEKALTAADGKALKEKKDYLLKNSESSLFKELKRTLAKQESQNPHVKKVLTELSNCTNLGQMQKKFNDTTLMYPFEIHEDPFKAKSNLTELNQNQQDLAPVKDLVNKYIEAAQKGQKSPEVLEKRSSSKPGA